MEISAEQADVFIRKYNGLQPHLSREVGRFPPSLPWKYPLNRRMFLLGNTTVSNPTSRERWGDSPVPAMEISAEQADVFVAGRKSMDFSWSYLFYQEICSRKSRRIRLAAGEALFLRKIHAAP
jgi:hypothetical protein